jgi:hypothetical protein
LNTTEQEFVKKSFQNNNDDVDDNNINENDDYNIDDDKSIHYSRAYRGE